MTEQQKQALAYIAQALTDYSATLPPSVRGPFLRESQAAIKALEATPALSEPGEPATVHG
jgi:hypothetical protein